MSKPHPQHDPSAVRRRRSTTAGIAALAVALSGAVTGTVAGPASGLGTPAAPAALAAPVAAAPVVDATAHSVPGDHNSEMGCAADWDPNCDQAQLTERADGVWELVTTLPADSVNQQYQYKVASNRSWDGPNFSIANGAFTSDPSAGNVTYTYPGGPIGFYFNPQDGSFFSTAAQPVLSVPGSFNSEVGCSGDWQPDCLRTMMTDPDRDGVFTFTTDQIPEGNYAFKVAHGQAWSEAYPASDLSLQVGANDVIEFRYDLATHAVSYVSANPPLAGEGQLQAQWIAQDVVVVPDAMLGGNAAADVTFTLHTATRGGITVEDAVLQLPTTARSFSLVRDEGGLGEELTARFPHLSGYTVLRVKDGGAAPTADVVKGLLTGQLVVTGALADDTLVSVTGVQIPGVLDDLYDASGRELGVTWTNGRPSLALWAPTAKDVDVLVWADGNLDRAPYSYQARLQADGSWTLDGLAGWKGGAYRFEVDVYAPASGTVEVHRVTDPYSVGLALNSTHSVFVDLADPAFRPAQWEDTAQPVVRPVDQTIYELHVRDFSVHDETVPAELRGTYLAFAEEDTAGRSHLRDLKAAGLTTVHLLPTFDIATIEEDRSKQAAEPAGLAALPPDSDQQQARIGAIRDQDAFNWGYDPFHFSTPEGSYAVQAHGGSRVAEFRTMVGALHSDGLQVVLDKVFNHTNASGQVNPKSVLDRIVPGYYHRLSAVGTVEQSTCCENVATEHEMAEKLMVDSVVTWARDYKVDGFRFDLMGHHSRDNMLAVREALDALTPETDGVDGSAVYLYGEGWNFGEVANDARFEQARQGNLGGTGIGTFSDRLRDAVRGGGPFDEDPRVRQGFGSGAFTDQNGLDNRTQEQLLADAQHQADLVRLGLAGNLRDFSFLTSQGEVQRGDEIEYNGQPAGYADSPEEIITYVDKHDNETLFDILTLKLPVDTPMAERVRMNTVSLATTTLSQTPAFYHAGSDLLRSKSLDRNSYNSGDWFNRLDFTGEDNGFARGLPQAPDNQGKWPTLAPLLANPALKPSAADVGVATEAYQELLRLRFSTDLFRLGEAGLIQDKVTFPNSGPDAEPGVVVMSIDDLVGGADVDPALDGVLVVFNASDETYSEVVDGQAGRGYELSDIQEEGADDVVRSTTWDAATGTVTVPARTVAVLTDASPVATHDPVRVENRPDAVPGTPYCVAVDDALDIPADATGLMVNVTTVKPSGLGHVVVYPAAGGSTVPGTSTVNFEPGKDVANSTFVALPEDGRLCYLLRGAAAGIILDVTGYTTAGSGVELATPERLLDTRPTSRVGTLAGPLAPGRAYQVQVAGEAGVPADATSVLVNVTVTGVSQLGNLRVYPAGEKAPNTSTVNYAIGADKANTTLVRLVDGKVSLWSDTAPSNHVNVVLDVLGWTTADAAMVGVDPQRLADSRPGRDGDGLDGTLQARRPYTLEVGTDVVPAGATAVVLNVTAVNPTQLGNLRVFPARADGAVSGSSAVNYIPGRDIPNLAVVALPADRRITLWSDTVGTVDVVLDVVGYVRGGGAGPAVN